MNKNKENVLGTFELKIPITARKVNKVKVFKDIMGNEYPVESEAIIVNCPSVFRIELDEDTFNKMFKRRRNK